MVKIDCFYDFFGENLGGCQPAIAQRLQVGGHHKNAVAFSWEPGGAFRQAVIELVEMQYPLQANLKIMISWMLGFVLRTVIELVEMHHQPTLARLFIGDRILVFRLNGYSQINKKQNETVGWW